MHKLIAFLRGIAEFRSDFTWADPKRGEHDLTDLDCAYDAGREFAHKATLRFFE